MYIKLDLQSSLDAIAAFQPNRVLSQGRSGPQNMYHK